MPTVIHWTVEAAPEVLAGCVPVVSAGDDVPVVAGVVSVPAETTGRVTGVSALDVFLDRMLPP